MKNKIIFSSLCLLCVISLTAQDFSGGNGSVDAPYQITNREQLGNLQYYLGTGHRGKHFMLMNDIDLSEEEWMPIGNSVNNSFQGYLHGNNKEIRHLRINETADDYEYTGLFGAIADGAAIDSLHLVSSFIRGKSRGSSTTGSIAGVAYSHASISLGRNLRHDVKIIACSNSGAVVGGGSTGSNTGGLIGQVVGSGYGRGSGRAEGAVSIAYCRNYADVTSGQAEFGCVGGLVGVVTALGNATGGGSALGAVEILYSYNRGNINALKGDAGGLAGFLNINQTGNAIGEIRISNCYATGTIIGMPSYAGGISGRVRQEGSTIVLKNNVAIQDYIEGVDDEYTHRLIGSDKKVSYITNFALESMMVNGIPVESDEGKEGTGKTFRELFTQATYTDTLVFLWDFDSICSMRSDNVNLPYLACQSAPVVVNNFTPDNITINVYNDLQRLEIYNNRTGVLLTTIYDVKAGYANYPVTLNGELLPNDPIAVYSFEQGKQSSYPIVLNK